MPGHQATPIRRAPGCLWAKAGCRLGTLGPARTRPTGYAYATLKRYTQTLHKAQDSVIGGMAEYEIEDRRVRREQKIRLVNV